jgi:hypothetical protein|tara:strand:+ start:2288 stop:7129 length:4842 start_codon:yes stop_codon:yes gene_type:complete
MTFTPANNDIGFENEEKPTVDIGIDQKLQEVGYEDETTVDTTEEQQPEVEFENVFDNKKIFNMDKSWIDWDTEYNFSDYTNTFLQDGEEPFDLYAEPNDKTRNIFNKTILFTDGEDTVPNIEARLKFLSVYDFIKGNQFTNLGFNNKPIKGLRDRQQFFKLIKQETGFTGEEFLGNKIPREKVETEEFQNGLANVMKHYEDKGFTINMLEADDESQLNKLAKGMGIEIGVGITADYVFAPLLLGNGWSKAIYALGQFAVGYTADIESQKQQLKTEDRVNFKPDQRRAIAAGFTQIIPFGVTLKGPKGIVASAGYGGTIATTETFLRDILGDDVTLDEYYASFGLGATFGGTLKTSIEGLDKVFTKYKNFRYDKINNIFNLNKKDVQVVEEATENITKANKVLKNDIESKGENYDNIGEKLKNEGSGTSSQTNTKPIDGSVRTYIMPSQFKRDKPRYGDAPIVFQSDFDKMAWYLRYKKTKYSKNADKILESFISQGFTEAEIRQHGTNLHEKIKQIVIDKTGSAQAGRGNTVGLTIEVPADAKYSQEVQTSITGKKQNLGDLTKNPQSVAFIKEFKPRQQELVESIIRQLKDEDVFVGSKSQVQTRLEGLGMFDKGVVKLSNTSAIKEYAEMYAKMYNLVPSDSLNFAVAQVITLATENVANKNQIMMDLIKTKDSAKIQKSIDDLFEALTDVEEWLTLGLPLRTQAGRTVKSFGMKTEQGIEGKTVEEITGMTPAEKAAATAKVPELQIDIDDAISRNQLLKTRLTEALEEATKTGDYSKLNQAAVTLKAASGDPRKLVAIQNQDAISTSLIKGLDKGARILNEIGINAVLSGPNTQAINLYSGAMMTFMKAMNNFVGASSVTELRAAQQYMSYLFYNLDFGVNAWKRSWDMEDNFINVGNVKGDTGQRFIISSDSSFWPLRAYDEFGRIIRLPSRLMTANDALIQAPNIIAATAFEAFNEGVGRNLEGEDLTKYIKGTVDGVISYLLRGQEGTLGRIDPLDEGVVGPRQLQPTDAVIQRILTRAKEVGKTITFTQDIRTDSYFGKGAKFINDAAINNPAVRFYFKFTRTPTNMFLETARYLPIVNMPIQVDLPNGQRVNINVVNQALLPDMVADLNSPDPYVRQQANGQIRMGAALGTLMLFLTNKQFEDVDDEYKKEFLTGGGPNFYTKEGAAQWISMYKNGWRPYSKAVLQYDENGDPLLKNGKPVYIYKSLEFIPDPLASLVRTWLDFAEMQPWLYEGDLDAEGVAEYVGTWFAFVGRNMFGKTYTSQISELLKILSAGGQLTEQGIDEGLKYRDKKLLDYIGRQVSANFPYSSLFKRLARVPAAIKETMGFTEEDAKALFESTGDPTQLRKFIKRDSKTYSGDGANESLPYSDEDFNKANFVIQALENTVDKMFKEIVPLNVGGKLPSQVEHITNNVVTYPRKEGGLFQFIYNRPIGESQNFLVLDVQAEIGKMLPPPPDIIRGSVLPNLRSAEFIPKKLDRNEYNDLKKITNVIELKYKGKDMNIKEAINAEINTPYIQSLRSTIKNNGLQSEEGQKAAELIFQSLSKINTKYIKAGMIEYMRTEMTQKDIDNRINAVEEKNQNFNDVLLKEFDKLNLGTFNNSSF